MDRNSTSNIIWLDNIALHREKEKMNVNHNLKPSKDKVNTLITFENISCGLPAQSANSVIALTEYEDCNYYTL
jgi:hypothetical protein